MKKSPKHSERGPRRATAIPDEVEASWGTGDKLQRMGLACVTALFVATPLVPSEAAAQEGSGLVIVILWMTLLVGWGLVSLRFGRSNVRLGATDFAAFAFLTLYSLSAVVMGRQGHARPALNMLWEYVSLGTGYFLARQWLRRAPESRALAAVMIALAVCLAVHGFYQVGYSLPRDRARWEHEPDVVLREAGVVAPLGSPIRTQYANRLASREPFATFSLANSLAGFLAPWLVFALGIGLAAAHQADVRPRTWISVGGSAVLIAACLLLTKSRSAYVATAAGVALLAGCLMQTRWRQAWRLVAAAAATVAVLVAAASVFGALDRQVLTEAHKSLGYRWEYWQATLAMIADHPWFGCGPGNFQEYYAHYKLPQSSEMVADPHNFLLEIWSTAGTPALIGWLVLLATFVWHVRAVLNLPAAPRGDAPDDDLANKSKRGVAHVYWGALLGVGAGFAAALVVGFAPDFVALAVAVPLGALSLIGLHGWVCRGVAPMWLAVIAIVVLLVNLLAAGGIGFPGVAQTFWILLAIALHRADEAKRPASVPRGTWGGVLLALTLALLGAAWFTAYGPVLMGRGSQGLAELNEARHNPVAAEQAYLAWAENDPWSAEPYRALAEMHHRAWLETDRPDHFRDFEQALSKAIKLNPHSHRLRSLAGDRYLHAYRVSGSAEFLDRAITAYEAAARLYPNSNIGHAQLAWALYVAGRDEVAAREAQVSLDLDVRNPHAEQKLKEQAVFDIEPVARFQDQRPIPARDDKAEPLMLRLRNMRQPPGGGGEEPRRQQ